MVTSSPLVLCPQVAQLPRHPRLGAEGQAGCARGARQPPDEPLRVLHGEEPQGGGFRLCPQHPGRCRPLQHPGGCQPQLGLALLSLPFPYPQPHGIGAGGTSPVRPCPPERVLAAPEAFRGSRCGRGCAGKG